jgi:hypothetical protein
MGYAAVGDRRRIKDAVVSAVVGVESGEVLWQELILTFTQMIKQGLV